MEKKINWYKIGILAAIIAGMFLLGRSCGIKSVLKNEGVDTTIRKDSIVIRYKPVPYKIIEWDTQWLKSEKVYIHDTTPGTYEVRIDPADTAKILERYNEKVYYSDTKQVNRGTVTVIDTLQFNRIAGREIKVNISDTTIIKTIVLRPPRKMVGFITGSAMGNFKNPISGAGIGFGLKLPNDMVYNVEYKVVNGYRPMIEGRVMFPIRLAPKIKPR